MRDCKPGATPTVFVPDIAPASQAGINISGGAKHDEHGVRSFAIASNKGSTREIREIKGTLPFYANLC